MSLLTYYFFIAFNLFSPPTLFSPPAEQAPLENFYKEIECSSPSTHKIRNIDFIYLINLDRRPERWISSSSQLSNFGITPYRFSAVDAKMLSLEEIENLGIRFLPFMQAGIRACRFIQKGEKLAQIEEKIGRISYGHTYFSEGIVLGALGCMLSHLSILQHAYDAGFETIWIMEDDIIVLKDPRILSDLIEHLDRLTDWDVLYTDQRHAGHPESALPCPIPLPVNHDRNWFSTKQVLGEMFFQINARWGTHSMIVHRSGMKKILDWVKTYRLYHPIDHLCYLIPGMKLYTVIDKVVTASYLESDTCIPLEVIYCK